MKIVVDTNIIFSGLLNSTGSISDLLINSYDVFEFYSPTFVLEELENHKSKILKISKLTEKELDFLILTIFKKVDLIDMDFIKQTTFKKAFELTKNIDEFDTPFVALALELKSPLWTGDKKLINGLAKIGIDWTLTTENVREIRDSY